MIDTDIQSRIDERRELYSSLVTSPKLSDMKVQTSSENKVEDTYIKLIELGKRIDDEIDRLIEIKMEASEMIDKISDQKHIIVLRERYINCKDWVDIAAKMDRSTSYIHSIHGKALMSFDRVYKKVVNSSKK